MDRRRFLFNTSLAITHLVAASSLFSGGLVERIFSEETIQQKLKRAADIRKSVSQGTQWLRRTGNTSNSAELELAKSIYDEVISMNNMEVRAYDGIRKILLQAKFKELAVLNLFLTPLNTFADNTKFTERVAKEYMRLALGNKKYVAELGSTPGELLENAKALFDTVRTAKPLNKDYQAQYQKAETLMEMEAPYIDARDNPLLKIKKREDRQTYKYRFDRYNASEVEVILNRMRGKAHSQQFRDTSKIMIGKLMAEGDIQLAITELQSLYYYEPNDANTLLLIRKTCKKNHAYDVLEEIDRFNNTIKNTLWSNIAVFDTLLLRHKHENGGDFTEMETFLSAAWPQANSFTKKFEIKSRYIKSALTQNNTASALNLLLSLADFITGITSSHWIDRFNFLCADYYKRNNEPQKGILVYSIALQENDMPVDDMLLKKLHIINKQRNMETIAHNDTLRYFQNLLAN